MKPLKRIFGILILLFFSVTSVFASAGELSELKASLRTEVTSIVSQIDAEAFIYVNLTPKKVKVNLPSTPFYIPDLALRNEDKVSLESVEIKIYTHFKAIPEDYVQMINDVFAQYEVIPQLNIKPLPSAPSSSAGAMMREFLKPQNFAPYTITFITLLGLLFLGFLIVRGQKDISGSVEKGTQRLAESFQNKEDHESRARAQQADNEQAQVEVHEDSEKDESIIRSLSQERLIELFSDCYWCEKDNYAAYLWTKTSISQRKSLLDRFPERKAYFSFAGQLATENLGFHNDPYYINPLPFCELSNEAVAAQIAKQPALYQELSSMRQEFIEISVTERVRLMKEEGKTEHQWEEDLAKLEKSQPRTVRQRFKLKIKSDEDELAVMQLEDLTLEMKEDFVTLGWAQDLSKEELSDILRQFSAQELAEIWVGPSEVLSHIKEALPEKKMALIESYMEKMAPTRNSTIYRDLHAEIIKRLQLKEAMSAIHDTESGNDVSKAS